MVKISRSFRSIDETHPPRAERGEGRAGLVLSLGILALIGFLAWYLGPWAMSLADRAMAIRPQPIPTATVNMGGSGYTAQPTTVPAAALATALPPDGWVYTVEDSAACSDCGLQSPPVTNDRDAAIERTIRQMQTVRESLSACVGEQATAIIEAAGYTGLGAFDTAVNKRCETYVVVLRNLQQALTALQTQPAQPAVGTLPGGLVINAGLYGRDISYCYVAPGEWSLEQRAQFQAGLDGWRGTGITFSLVENQADCETFVSWSSLPRISNGQYIAGQASVGPGRIEINPAVLDDGCPIMNIAMHEAGHNLGLMDVENTGTIMNSEPCWVTAAPLQAEVELVASAWGTR